MWNLNYPLTINSKKTLLLAFPIKHGKDIADCKLDDSHHKILNLYERYNILKGTPNVELQDKPEDKKSSESLYNAYEKTQANRPLNFIRSELKKATKGNKCPYCGIGEISSIDHYLPRKNYKSFSIHIENLIPCCQVCNTKKSSIANLDPNKQFLHAYFNQLNSSVVLYAKMTIIHNGYNLKLSILNNEKNPRDLSKKVKFQFEHLELDERLDAEINDFIFNQMGSFEYIYKAGTTALIDHFAERYLTSQKKYNHNHWITAIWRAFLQCDDLCKMGPACLKQPK